ncbi:MAG: HAMP domain-containing protein [Candidatus Cloacimonetes bacterium]|nr:HAMP domain-containing protein [Candidatus Cloacimonadota bacterium]
MNRSNWTLRKKILVGYTIAFLLMVLVIIYSLLNIIKLGEASAAILKENYKSILAAENMIDAIERQDSAILLLILNYTEEASIQFRENQNQFLLCLGRALDNITIENEDEIISTIQENYNLYLINFNKLQRIVLSNSQDASEFYHEQVLPNFIFVRDECIHLREINQETMFNASNVANHIARRAIRSIIVLSIALLATGLIFSLILVNLIVKPVHQIINATQRISDGDYNVQFKYNRTDELGILSKDFNRMVKKLKIYHDLNIKKIIREKSKSEAVIQSIDDGIIIINDESKIEDINPAAARIFNLEIEKTRGKHILEIIRNNAFYEEITNVFTGNIQTNQEQMDEKIFTIGESESKQHLLYSIISVNTGNAENDRMVVILLKDITSLKKLDNLKSEFIMAASHELRTPLTSINMSISLLKENLNNKLDKTNSELLSAAYDEVNRLKVLVNDLLDISRIEAGKMTMDFDRVEIKYLFEKAISVIIKQANEKKVETSIEIHDDLPVIKADPNKITRVLANLMANALRYTPKGGFIKLKGEKIGSKVHISVQDNGSGIPYEFQSRIFDKFVQVKNDSNPGGSGLGLSICREIVKAHGGNIWVESIPGEGSTFTFTLPVFEEKEKKV